MHYTCDLGIYFQHHIPQLTFMDPSKFIQKEIWFEEHQIIIVFPHLDPRRLNAYAQLLQDLGNNFQHQFIELTFK